MSRHLAHQEQVRIINSAHLLCTNTNPSIEGQPVYSHEAFGPVHEFIYGHIIPSYIHFLTSLSNQEVTPHIESMYTRNGYGFGSSLEFFLERINQRLLANGVTADFIPTVTNYNDAELQDRAEDILIQLRGNGLTMTADSQEFFHAPHQDYFALTTSQGRPTAAVVDAANQLRKAESGLDTVIMVHTNEYRREQRRMLRVLLAAQNSQLPFTSFVNVFVQNRNNVPKISSITHYSRNASASQV